MSEHLPTQSYKGTRDFYPDDMRIQQWMFGKLREVVTRYGYEEYTGPMIEAFELYAAKTGDEIVNNQLYWFVDRGGRKVAVRPEMTPTLARMVAAKLNDLPRPIRWFSVPNLWRYEKPQRGRLREHWQLNVDVLGGDPLLADAELLTLAVDLIRAFSGEDKVQIRVNHRGLVDFFFKKHLNLSAQVALQAARAIDARAKIGEEKYNAWLKDLGITAEQVTRLEEFFHSTLEQVTRSYPCEAASQLTKLFEYLGESGASRSIVFDPKILRGLDYYTGTVFEMYDVSPENNRAMFGGGRYDNLIGLFGKQQLGGVGLGMGDVTLRNFLETHKFLPSFGSKVDVLVGLPKTELRSKAEEIARALREQGLSVMTPLSVGGFGEQIKLATRHGARLAVLLGEEELKTGKVVLKDLEKREQTTPEIAALSTLVTSLLKKG